MSTIYFVQPVCKAFSGRPGTEQSSLMAYFAVGESEAQQLVLSLIEQGLPLDRIRDAIAQKQQQENW